MLDERGNISPRIAFQVRKDEDLEELPASEALTPSIAIGVLGYGDEHTSERSWFPQLGPMFVQTPLSLPVSRGHP